MSPKQTLNPARPRSTAVVWFASVVVGVLLGIATRWLMPVQVEADHPKIPDNHLGTINTFAVDNFCVWLEDSTMSFGTALNRVSGTLLDDNGWDGLKGGRVLFSGGSTPCVDDPNRINIEIEYWVKDDTSGTNCGGFSCAWFLPGDVYEDPISGHVEFRYGYVRFVTAHINGSLILAHHVVNHETGHILGLCDGGPDATDPANVFLGCTLDADHFNCVDSVMHSQAYGCSNREWPTSLDRAAVESLIPGGVVGGGGGMKGCYFCP